MRQDRVGTRTDGYGRHGYGGDAAAYRAVKENGQALVDDLRAPLAGACRSAEGTYDVAEQKDLHRNQH